MLTVWMLEKSEKIPEPAALVVWKQRHNERFTRETSSFISFWLLIWNNLEAAATSVCPVDREGEPEDGGADQLVQGSFTVPVVKDIIEDELGLVVAGVDNRTDLDGQANGGRATIHWDVRVFFKREAAAASVSMKDIWGGAHQ